MNRYRSYGRLDDPSEFVGDAAFVRLDMRTDSAALAPGTVQRSENFRFDQAGAQVRGGIARQLPPGASVSTIRHCGIYRPDNSHDRLALVTERALILFDPNAQTLTQYDFPVGETITETDKVDFIQAGVSSGTVPDAYILRGLEKDALKFDGSVVTAEADFDRAEFGLFFSDRIALNTGRQEFSVTDYLDFETINALNRFAVLKGGDDYLVSALAYQIGQVDVVIVGSRKRCYVAFFQPLLGDGEAVDAGNSFLRGLTREAGPIGREAMIEAGGLIWVLSDLGIFAFQPQLDLELTVLGQPISAALQPLMDRLSANYAARAVIQRSGHRLYFALPINPEPIPIVDIEVTEGGGLLELPFTLPAVLSGSANLATVETETAHNLASGDQVQIVGVMDPLLNGVWSVIGAPDATHFTIATDAAPGADVGERATAQPIVTRNNRIAIYNLVNQGWESVDTLPAGIYADWLRIADHGARRRLWLIDRVNGPALYEEGDVDETSDAVGGLRLAFTLPAQLSAANYASVPIPGLLKSRTLRWGPNARHVKAGESRLTVQPGDAGTFTVRVNTPDSDPWESERAFDGTGKADTAARKRCGKRGLEAELEILTTAGRPLVRTLQVETTVTGRVKEE